MFKTLSQGGYTSKEYIIYEEKIYNGFMFEVKFFSYSIQPSIHQWSQILCPTNILRLMVKCTYSKMSHHLSVSLFLNPYISHSSLTFCLYFCLFVYPSLSYLLNCYLSPSLTLFLSLQPSLFLSLSPSYLSRSPHLSLPSLSFSCSPSLLASLRIFLISFS